MIPSGRRLTNETLQNVVLERIIDEAALERGGGGYQFIGGVDIALRIHCSGNPAPQLLCCDVVVVMWRCCSGYAVML